MTKKFREFRTHRHPKPAWKPVVHGMGSVLNLIPKSDYFSLAQRFTNPWPVVGGRILCAAETLGTALAVSHHVFDLKVKAGNVYTVGKVFEYNSPHRGNCYVAIYDHGDKGIAVDCTAARKEVETDDSDEDEMDLYLDEYGEDPEQADWVEQAQSEY